ncbi:rhodanese-like domain-containing protein [Segetibacter koreensis]|uniref:rhodanese-like domain-containing protein n=1 Tax=Segetibacter koreensis TaxID=398037 RepID=UPI0003776EC0|nr:rhodanese-like domain-containing protein [Segetibacter koreensis]
MFTFLKNLFKPSADFAKLVKEGAVIVDVRTTGEFQAGHIEGSKNIPLDTVKNEVEKLKKLNKPFVTVCRSGNRSAMAKSILSSAGIVAYNGGAWTNLKRQLT